MSMYSSLGRCSKFFTNMGILRQLNCFKYVSMFIINSSASSYDWSWIRKVPLASTKSHSCTFVNSQLHDSQYSSSSWLLPNTNTFNLLVCLFFFINWVNMSWLRSLTQCHANSPLVTMPWKNNEGSNPTFFNPVCKSICMYEYIHVWVYVCMSICMHEHMYVGAYVC